MKRCPHCNFIFPNSDEVCDFDKTRLVAITENEIDAQASAGTLAGVEMRRENRKALLMAAIVGISLGLVLFVVYRATHRQTSSANEAEPQLRTSNQPMVAIVTPSPESSPTPDALPSVQATSNIAKSVASPGQTAAHAKVSTGPVSTSTEAKSATGEGKPVFIILTSGGKVEADEVWRTKEGVWYRRNGVVTLLKSNRVKAIVNQ
jgi:hypothetical protein